MFANTLGYKELRRLDSIGIHYRIPLPGARYHQFFFFFFAVFQVNSIAVKETVKVLSWPVVSGATHRRLKQTTAARAPLIGLDNECTELALW